MKKNPLILGIETSCDETAASIISENEQGNPIVLSNIISSQVDIHKEFGGVVPELAARSHIEKIDLIANKALNVRIRRPPAKLIILLETPVETRENIS